MPDVMDRISIVTGDITALPSEMGVVAIVNAANTRLASGGGVDGAIHRAAGSEQLLAYNAEHHPDGVSTGLAVVSPAFDLESRGISHIIHTAGPVWGNDTDPDAKLGYTREDTLLASCYTRCLDLCVEHGLATNDGEAIAFPGISTGVYGFPKPRAAKIAFGHVHGHLLKHPAPSRVVFCCFSDEDATILQTAIDSRGEWMFSRPRV